MASIKASPQGLVKIKKAIARKGWKIASDRPLVEASQIFEPDKSWQELGPYAYDCSRQTWERFLQGIAIRDRSFRVFCQVVGVEPDDVAQSASVLREDWGEAPDVPIFHGRERELATLQRWILREKCRAIAIVGLAGIGKIRLVRGGIGKTDLSLKLARQVRGEFEYLIWRRLLNVLPPEAILTELSQLPDTHLLAYRTYKTHNVFKTYMRRRSSRVPGETPGNVTLTMRLCLARLHRATLCYSKSTQMLKYSVRLLMHYLRFKRIPVSA